MKVYDENIEGDEEKLPSLPDVPIYEKFTEDYINKLPNNDIPVRSSANFSRSYENFCFFDLGFKFYLPQGRLRRQFTDNFP